MIPLIGRRFGKLLVDSISHKDYQNKVYWKCMCDCGTLHAVRADILKSGGSTSCGCYKPNITHGKSRTPEYKTWISMKGRCLNPSYPQYPRYGGRGIKVCRRWLISFTLFLRDMGKRPKGHSLDRINNNGNYCKSNCRWALPKEQQRNRTVTPKILYKGVVKPLPEWADLYGLPTSVLWNRLYILEWSVHKSLHTPTGGVLSYS